jgi:sporulation protein YlmC with PRC-barrel domain
MLLGLLHSKETAMETQVRKAYRSANVIGIAVKTPDHKKIGEIEELVIDLETGKLAYAVLSFGGHFGFGEKSFAVPWNEFSFMQDETEHYFVLDTNVQKLRKLPGFNKTDWPDMFCANWRCSNPAARSGIELIRVELPEHTKPGQNSRHSTFPCANDSGDSGE